MTKRKTTLKFCASLLAVCLSGVVLTSCHDDDDYMNLTVRLAQTDIPYSSDGVWSGVADNQPFQSQYMVFSHSGEVGPWGLVWSGFTPARCSDNSDPGENWMGSQFNIMTGGGMAGVGTPYIVAYWNTQENATTPAENRSCRLYYSSHPDGEHYMFSPMSVYVTNTCYGYYTMVNGSAFSEPFTADDYLTLKAHGVHSDGSEDVVSMELAGADVMGNLRVIDSWEQFSLSSLGEVTEIYFTMESSQTNAWGMIAPSYFALDCLSFRAKLPGK